MTVPLMQGSSSRADFDEAIGRKVSNGEFKVVDDKTIVVGHRSFNVQRDNPLPKRLGKRKSERSTHDSKRRAP